MKIERKRWVIMRNDYTEIFCGLAQNYQFKPVDNIGDTAIKTYRSEKQAVSSFKNSWRKIDFEYKVLPVTESYEIHTKKKNIIKEGD